MNLAGIEERLGAGGAISFDEAVAVAEIPDTEVPGKTRFSSVTR